MLASTSKVLDVASSVLDREDGVVDCVSNALRVCITRVVLSVENVALTSTFDVLDIDLVWPGEVDMLTLLSIVMSVPDNDVLDSRSVRELVDKMEESSAVVGNRL